MVPETPQKQPISLQQKKNCLESALYQFLRTDAFYANFLQEVGIVYDKRMPSAAMTYNKENNEFRMILNPHFFCEQDLPGRVSLLFHEALHFMNQHLFRFNFDNLSEEDRMIQNVAMDMAINQFIQDAGIKDPKTGEMVYKYKLPDGCVDVKNFKHIVNGKSEPFPEKKTAEAYLELLKDPKNKEANSKELGKYKASGGYDVHDWESLSEEEKQRMLSEAKKILQRTVEKSNTGHNTIPDSIKDLLQAIDSEIQKLDYKGILKRVIKRTLSVSDRSHTWNRPSKRYGVYSKGTEIGKLPNCEMLVDTSGSISHKELNEFLTCISGFLKVGGKKCVLSLWHTDLYYTDKYKLHGALSEKHLESGGTDIKAPMMKIQKSKPNLAIILTDGYFDKVEVPVTSEILWIISKGGNSNHPMVHVGRTITLDSLL